MGMLSQRIYGKDMLKLTEDEKATISAFSTLAAGIAGMLSGGDTQSVASAAQAGKTTVENNYLHASEDKARSEAEIKLDKINQGLMHETEGEKQALENQVALLNTLDKYRDEVLTNACQNISSTECGAAKANLDAAYKSYFETLKPDDREAYNDAYATYTKYYNGYKDIESLSFDLNVAEVEADRKILAQRLAKEWNIDESTADKIVLGARITHDLVGVTAMVVGPKVIDEVGVIKPNIGKASDQTNKLSNSQYLKEMSDSGIKFSPENILRVEKLADGRIVFLEKGNSSAGLQHIVERHADEFAKIGVLEAQIPDIIMDAVSSKPIGYQGSGTGRPIYEVTINGQKQKIAVTTGSNGFIVGANPAGVVK